MTSEELAADAALFARMRAMWEAVDPMPADLIDRMVASVAVMDLSREYALLTLVESELSEVRGETDTATLQFSDGTTSVLLHITEVAGDRRRIDGWVDGTALAVSLVQDGGDQSAEPDDNGRFAFDGVTKGVSRIRLVVRADGGGLHEFQTPQFEV